MLIQRWVTAQGDKQLSRVISQKYNISPFAAHILVTRGCTQDEDIQRMLRPTEFALGDPYEFADMAKAVARIRRAVEQYELIAVYGDYDVDGVTATSLLYSCFERLGARVMFMLPSRDDGGYGLHMHTVDSMIENGVNLIVTVDNGVSAEAEIAYAVSHGIDVIVTDHHHPPETLPDAVAVLDAHIPGNSSGYPLLAGVGVAFRLACALENDVHASIERYADLVALGTIADSVPLTGENRALVQLGLERLRTGGRCGVRALMTAAKLEYSRLTAGDVSFGLAPRINSAGRLGKPDSVVRLMLSNDPEECRQLAMWLCSENCRRHDCEKDISDQAWEILEKNPSLADERVVIIVGENWNSGVVGIFAARLSERMGKPAVVLTIEGETARGSCRGPEGFSFHKALTYCSDLLVMFGGHSQAAGFTVRTENIELLRSRINEYASSVDIPVPVISTDCRLPISAISLSLVSGLAPLEPFGTGNPAPLIEVYGAQITDIRSVGNGGHQRITFSDDRGSLTAMLFGVTGESMQYRRGDRVDFVLSVGVKNFRGINSVDAVIKDIRLSSIDCEDVINGERLFDRLRSGRLQPGEAAGLLPTREETGEVYRYIRNSSGYDRLDTICARLGTIPFGKLRASVEILRDCGFVRVSVENGYTRVWAPQNVEKGSLDDSATMQRLKELVGNTE